MYAAILEVHQQLCNVVTTHVGRCPNFAQVPYAHLLVRTDTADATMNQFAYSSFAHTSAVMMGTVHLVQTTKPH